MKLKVGTTGGKPFEIEADSFVTKACAIIGIRGSGKTYAAEKLAELIYDAGKQIVVIDPVGVWYSLRLGERKGQGLDVAIFGGLHGDIPLSKASGALIADVLIDRQISAVIDVSQFETDVDKARFARDFADRFYFRKKSSTIKTPVHIFVEEAQEFIPQNIQRGEEQMLHVWQRMIRLGRNFKIGVSMISQRPQDVNKKALNQAEWVFAFQLRGTQERKAVEDWIANNGIDEKLAQRLPSLVQGEAYVWSPTANTIVRIDKKRTFDASSDVTQDESAVEPKPLRAHDLEALRKSFVAIEEEQKSNDPKALKAKIAELQKQIAQPAKAAPISKAVEPKRIEVPVLKDGQLKRAEAIVEKLSKLLESGNNIFAALAVAIQKVNAPAPKPVQEKPQIQPPQRQFVRKEQTTPKVRTTPSSGGNISNSQQRILNALAWLESIRVMQAPRTIVAFLSGVSSKSSGYNNNLGSLRTSGYIEYPQPNIVCMLENGRAIADQPDTPLTSSELHSAIYQRLSGSQVTILKCVIKHYPASISRDDLAEEIGASALSSGYNNNLGSLRTFGFIGYPQQGHVVAEPLLFID